MMERYKPGPGWKHIGGAVWDHVSGTRLHVMGLCELPSGQFVDGMMKWPECQERERYIQINGGNRKRGSMAWARNNPNSGPAAA